jgi:DNA-binding LacI/PurR family transcriptional regulator
MSKTPIETTNPGGRRAQPCSLKELAQYLDLSPSTVSVVLNNVPGRSISEATRIRIREAAAKFRYRPSMLARSLRQQQTQTIGVLLPEVGEGYHAQVLCGVANELERNRYSYLIAQHRHDPERINEYTDILVSRGAEGFIAIDTHLTHSLHVPVVAVAGHKRMADVTNVILNHDHAAMLTLRHLQELGHREIAVIKGQKCSSDTATRWKATIAAARAYNVNVPKNLVVQLDREVTSPEIAYSQVQNLLRAGRRFTAIICFNDIAALGAIRAINDAGLRIPDDVSVVGFDDIAVAVFATPSITTIRQPLQQMGETAARVLLDRLRNNRKHRAEIAVEPELIVRESTGPARDRSGGRFDG